MSFNNFLDVKELVNDKSHMLITKPLGVTFVYYFSLINFLIFTYNKYFSQCVQCNFIMNLVQSPYIFFFFLIKFSYNEIDIYDEEIT